MKFYHEKDITDFFDVSIILPFYKKLEEFKLVLPRNLKYFQRNGIELIIVLDTPLEENELITFLDEFPFLNSKIIINRNYHQWRNPAKALNVGIRAAERKFVFIASPETEFFTDVIYQLRYVCQYYPKSFAIGQVGYFDFQTEFSASDIYKYKLWPYGSILVEKEFLCEIGGYSETLTAWGGDDDNIRIRLERLGIKKIEVHEAVAIHREKSSTGYSDRNSKCHEMTDQQIKEAFLPQKINSNSTDWGTDFKEICYSWKNRESNYLLLHHFISQFQKTWVSEKLLDNMQYKIVALIQVRNELLNLPDVLLHLDNFCDGIILLDDESSDGSFEAAISDRLLLKVTVTNKGFFDDHRNKNILLQLAHFFSAEWFFFFDADDRLDLRYSKLDELTNIDNIDSVFFSQVEMWDHDKYYRKDLPEGRNGILYRYRMFRNYGFMQIESSRMIHFPAIPYKRNSYKARILIQHFGYLEKKDRVKKYRQYILVDPDGKKQGYSYEYLLDSKVQLERVENLQI